MRLEKSDINLSNLEKSVNKLVTFSSKLTSLWTSSDYEGKTKIQNLIFPEGMSYFKKNDECRTPKTNPLFSYILVLKRVLEQKERGAFEVNFNYAPLVDPKGVEPPTF